jgi:hypothetical protein
MMATDTAPLRYPSNHSPHGTPDKLDFAWLGDVVDALGAAVHGLPIPA